MEASFSKELQALSDLIELLAAQRDEAAVKLRVALEEVADLKAQLKKTQEELHQKTLDVEFLTLSHKLADTPQSLAEARATVRRLKAGVDKAIALLRDDATI